MDKYDLKSDGQQNEGYLSVLEYQHGKKTQKKSFNNVYVKNFSTDLEFTDEQLATLFSTYGEILNASVMRDSEGKSKGFGFVCFKDPAAAEKATNELRGSGEDETQNEEDR